MTPEQVLEQMDRLSDAVARHMPGTDIPDALEQAAALIRAQAAALAEAEARETRLRGAIARVAKLEREWSHHLGWEGLGLILYGGKRAVLQARLRCQKELEQALKGATHAE